MRNVAARLRRHNQGPATCEARPISPAPDKKEALRRFRAWKEKGTVEEERAVRCPKKGLYNCLHYHDSPEEMWKRVRTANILKRAFRGVRRRTDPMGLFPDAESANRIFHGITDYTNKSRGEVPQGNFGRIYDLTCYIIFKNRVTRGRKAIQAALLFRLSAMSRGVRA